MCVLGHRMSIYIEMYSEKKIEAENDHYLQYVSV